MYFPLGILVEPEESDWNTRRVEDRVRSTREFIMKNVNFCELRKKEKSALKANWDAQMSEYVETGRYNNPIEYNIQSVAKIKPKEI